MSGSHGISFGTDGWRAIIADGFTVERVRIVAQAVADWLKETGRGTGRVLVGYDTRFGGEMFALAAGQVLHGNGYEVDVATEPVPTPAVSWRIPQQGYACGLMITASHNPAAYSGIKVKPHFGGSPDESVIGPIVAKLGVTPPRTGEMARINRVSFNLDYVAMLREMVSLRALRSLKGGVTFDPMGGVQAGNLARVLKGLPIEVEEIHGTFDPLFAGLHAPEPIEQNLQELMTLTRRHRAVAGIATDGDGDRLGLIAPDGTFVTPHKVFALLAIFMVKYRKLTGSVVKTVSGSFLIDRIARAHNLPIHETPVGFKYICKLMRETDVLIGGEESGGVGVKGYIPERDGLMMGLLVLELLAQSGKTVVQLLRQLTRDYGDSHYGRVDVRHDAARQLMERLKASPPSEVGGMKVARVNAMDGLKFIFADDSWLLFRASGTEPLLRIYAEAGHPKDVRHLLDSGAGLAGVPNA